MLGLDENVVLGLDENFRKFSFHAICDHTNFSGIGWGRNKRRTQTQKDNNKLY